MVWHNVWLVGIKHFLHEASNNYKKCEGRMKLAAVERVVLWK